MATFTPIDLSQVPAPSIVEALDYETILAAMVADLQARDPAFTALVESDPAYKILEVAAYREVLLRQRVNDACRQVLLAYAVGTNLDQLAALFGVQRLTIDPGDANAIPPVAPTLESDADLRRRVQLSLEGLSTAGPVGAYIYHALTVPSIADASVESPDPGEVVVTVLARAGNGTPTSQDLTDVEVALNAEDVRPLTDQVTVQAATIVNYAITATIYTYEGPDPVTVIAAAQAAAETFVASSRKLGRDITLSAVYAALHQPGVQRVVLASPSANVVCTSAQAAHCTAITLTNGGVAE
jgi:phage-related baseplate assembly protein